jgi:hypothetical protein
MSRLLIFLLHLQIDYTVLLRLYAMMDVFSKRYHGVPSNLLAGIGLEFWMPEIYWQYVPSI